jgi:hypothetical protein
MRKLRRTIPTQRRFVICSPLVPRRGRPRLWAYGYADLAALFGTTEGVLRKEVCERRFDPSDLRAVAARIAGKPA